MMVVGCGKESFFKSQEKNRISLSSKLKIKHIQKLKLNIMKIGRLMENKL